MRRAFIALGILVFLVYCWASVVYQNEVDVPAYRLVTVDLLGGLPREAWDGDQQAQFQRLMDLETKSYQLPSGDGEANPADKPPLASGDFAAFIAAHPGSPVNMALLDTSAFSSLLARNYLLRDTIPDPDNMDGKPLYFGGTQLDKEMLDDLRRHGIATITVSGHAAPVNFQIGTALMIAVIFLTLVAALKPVVWDPFIAMLEKRRRELEIGNEAERQNQLEAVRFEEEKRRRNADLGLRVQELRMRGQRETAREAGEIIREARDREKEVKLAGLRDIGRAADFTRAEMEKRIPELAEAVADALTPGRENPPWKRFEEK